MSTNAAAAKAIIDSQAAKGLEHYGAGLEASALTVSELARYGAEEAADLLAYLVEIERRSRIQEQAYREMLVFREDLATLGRTLHQKGKIILGVEDDPARAALAYVLAEHS